MLLVIYIVMGCAGNKNRNARAINYVKNNGAAIPPAMSRNILDVALIRFLITFLIGSENNNKIYSRHMSGSTDGIYRSTKNYP